MARWEIRHQDNEPRVWLIEDGVETQFPALWLRTRSHDPAECDPITLQRLYNPHQLPEDLALSRAEADNDHLHLCFSDGFATSFHLAELLADRILSEELPDPIAWQADLTPLPRYRWPELAESSVFFESLHDFITLGFLIITDTPTEPDAILRIARRFGYPRETNFGVLFEVYSRPADNNLDSDDLAYRAGTLGPHTDNPYRVPVPGIQLLHCLRNETSGGLSTLVDSLACAARLQQEDPDGFALLTEVPLRFRYRSRNAELVSVKPIIELDGQGRMTGVHYSPRMDDLPLMPEARLRRYHRARKRLAQLFEDPARELRFRLMPGELMMFDNNRVLHGRTAFDPAEGHRQLQGCYIDRDTPRSHYRLLARRFGIPAKREPA